MTEYERILNHREDMTQWVIHFTRADREGDGVEARDRLLRIVIDGLLKPGWSVRPTSTGAPRRTIYGAKPVVCFTEQPLSSFVQYLEARSGLRISGFGILTHKHDLYADGGRPVIYGMDCVQEVPCGEQGYVEEQRTLRNLNVDEQFRYSAFNPNIPGRPLDWSHEREWRWPQGANEPAWSDPEEVGHFRLAGSGTSSANGCSEGRAHVIVEREDDVKWLQTEVCSGLNSSGPPRGDRSYSDRWRRALAERVGVISLERVKAELGSGDRRFGRLETWPKDELIQIAGSTGPMRASSIFQRGNS